MLSNCFRKMIEDIFPVTCGYRDARDEFTNSWIDRCRADKQQVEHYHDQKEEPPVSMIYAKNFEIW